MIWHNELWPTATLAAQLELAQKEYKSCLKFGTNRWIDSAAAAAIVGECLFETGRYREAIGFYNEANNSRIVTRAIGFKTFVSRNRPLRARNEQVFDNSGAPCPDNIALSDLPSRLTIRLGTSDPQSVFARRRGVLSAPIEYPFPTAGNHAFALP